MKTIKILTLVLLSTFIVTACGAKKEETKSSFVKITETKSKTPAHTATKTDNIKVDQTVEQPVDTSGAESQPKEQIDAAKVLVSSVDEKLLAAIDGKQLFKNNCAICHGIKGNMEINGSKNLSKTKTSLEQRVAQIYFGKSSMIAFKGLLKDEEIVAVAQFIDTLRK